MIAKVLSVLLLGLSVACNQVGEQSSAQDAQRSTRAEGLLRESLSLIASAPQVVLRGEMSIDGALASSGEDEVRRFEARLKRPDRFKVRRETDREIYHFYFDGQTVTVFNETMNHYGTASIPGTLEEMAAALEDQYGFQPVSLELLLDNAFDWAEERESIKSSSYEGEEIIDGVPCHHVRFMVEHGVWELWLAVDDLLPRQGTGRLTNLEGNPGWTTVHGVWDLEAELDDSEFDFQPPEGALQIPMLRLEEIEAEDRAAMETEEGQGGE